MLGVKSTHPFHSWSSKLHVSGTAEAIAGELGPERWQRLSAGEGTKGARLHDWADLELADLDARMFNKALTGTWTRGLLVRRKLADGSLAHFTTWCPKGTQAVTLAAVEGRRWAVEDSFEAAKNELGLDHNETRSWHGWHRHTSMVMLAFAMTAAIRHHANQAAPQETSLQPAQARRRLARQTPAPQALSAGPPRKSAASQRASPKPASSPHWSSPGPSGDGRTRPAHNAHT